MKTVNLLVFFVITLTIICSTSCKPTSYCNNFDDTALSSGKSCLVCNDSIYAAYGFTIRAAKLDVGGVSYYSRARGEDAPYFFGSGNVLKTNKATLHFIHTGTTLPKVIMFNYLDMGGIENLSINGALYSGDLSTAPATLGDVTVSVTSTPILSPAKGKKGVITLSGAIREFKIGGQEFYIDSACFTYKRKQKFTLPIKRTGGE